MVRNIYLDHLSVCRSVHKVYCGKTADLDLDAVWGGEWGRSTDGCIRPGW